jgi:hypothetical protein
METQKVADLFICNFCDYTCSKKCNYEKHVSTRKHFWKQNGNKMETEKVARQTYDCLCGKKYKARASLWKHHKKCDVLNNAVNENENTKINVDDNDFIKILVEENKNLKTFMIEQNNDFKNLILDICKQMQPISNNNTINTINNNSNNKTFNLQVFLNETCKDAMNLTDFVNSIQIQLSDLENVGRNGFVAGISNIIMKNLKALDITQRPVHCSDHKREVMYVKDNNQWYNDSKNDNSEEPENQKLKKAIKQIAHKNICMISEWKAKYPDCIYSDSRKSDLYNHIIYESMDHSENNSDKIIKKIAKEVGIRK